MVDIRRHLKNSNRTAAMKLLRKKKIIELENNKKEASIEHLESVLTQIEKTDCSSLVKKRTYFSSAAKNSFDFLFRLSMLIHQAFKLIKNYYVKMVLHPMQLKK